MNREKSVALGTLIVGLTQRQFCLNFELNRERREHTTSETAQRTSSGGENREENRGPPHGENREENREPPHGESREPPHEENRAENLLTGRTVIGPPGV